MVSLTAIILTKNESVNITECIQSVKSLCERIVVVDSGSTDNTVQLAEKEGASVYHNQFVNYATQFNWALENCDIDTKWVLRLDADERFTEDLNIELEELLKAHDSDDVNGIMTESDFFFLGKQIKYGGPKKRKIMIFRFGFGYIEKRKMDEHTIVESGCVIKAKHRFLHYDFKDLDTWIKKMNWYATREMQDYFEDKDKIEQPKTGDAYLSRTRVLKFKVYYKFPKFVRCWLLFVYNYIFRLGFLDGKEGFVYHYMYQRWYRTLVDAKILEHEIYGGPMKETGALQD